MIKMIIKYFSLEQKQKRKKIRQLAIEITETQDYDELVKLVNEYNKLKQINKKIAESTIYREIVELTNEYNKIKNEN